MLGCERDLPYQVPSEKPIVGYQLEGYVTDRLGVPLKGVRVGLWYDYEFVDTIHHATPAFVVDDSTKVARVQVLDRKGRVEAIVFEGRTSPGIMDVEWDKRDQAGNPATSGVYTVDFSLNGASRASYAVVIDGAVTAATDSLGHYVIPDQNLPVGYYPVVRPVYGDPASTGNFRISPNMGLELYLDIRRGASVTLVKDAVIRRDFII